MCSVSPRAGLSRRPPFCRPAVLRNESGFPCVSEAMTLDLLVSPARRLNIIGSVCIFLMVVLGGAASGFGQIFSAGITGGVGLTDGIQNQSVGGYHFYSGSKDYIVGPMVELGLPFHLSVEADALYRPLSLASYIALENGLNTAIAHGNVTTWEFPLLAKYKFLFPLVKPFVELGPSFRAAGNLNGTSPSHDGVTLGGGVEVHLLWLKIAPQIRYTHWAPDNASPSLIVPLTNPNQVEFLLGLSF